MSCRPHLIPAAEALALNSFVLKLALLHALNDLWFANTEPKAEDLRPARASSSMAADVISGAGMSE